MNEWIWNVVNDNETGWFTYNRIKKKSGQTYFSAILTLYFSLKDRFKCCGWWWGKGDVFPFWILYNNNSINFAKVYDFIVYDH